MTLWPKLQWNGMYGTPTSHVWTNWSHPISVKHSPPAKFLSAHPSFYSRICGNVCHSEEPTAWLPWIPTDKKGFPTQKRMGSYAKTLKFQHCHLMWERNKLDQQGRGRELRNRPTKITTDFSQRNPDYSMKDEKPLTNDDGTARYP